VYNNNSNINENNINDNESNDNIILMIMKEILMKW